MCISKGFRLLEGTVISLECVQTLSSHQGHLPYVLSSPRLSLLPFPMSDGWEPLSLGWFHTQVGPVCCCTWLPRSLALGCHFISGGRITPLFCGLSICGALRVGKVLQGLLAVSPLIYFV